MRLGKLPDALFANGLPAGTMEDLEEERRLLYVAMTRATDDLHLIVPERFYVGGQSARGDRHLCASRTRFIPDTLLPLFERCSWPKPTTINAAENRPGPRMDIVARMR
jgi:DNA helicase-2/ATP-dependent DNA helicase PcrA